MKYKYDIKQLLFPVNDCNFYVQELELEESGEFTYKGKGYYFRTQAEAVQFVREQMVLDAQQND